MLQIRAIESDAYTNEHVALAERIGDQIAGAVDSAQLYASLEEAQVAQQRQSKDQEVLAEIGRIISSSLDITEVYESFAEQVREFIQFDRLVINIISKEKDTITNTYVSGIDVPTRGRADTFPFDGTFSWEAIRMRSTVLVQTEDRDELGRRFPRALPGFDAGLRSFMAVPLESNGAIIAVLQLRSLKPNAYTDKDVDLAQRVGAQIAGAVSNAQLYEERKQAEISERQRSDELATLFRIAGMLAQPGTLQRKAATVADEVVRTSNATGVELRLFDENTQELRLIATGGKLLRKMTINALPLDGAWIACRAYRDGQPIVVNDYPVYEYAEQISITNEVVAAAAMPILSAGEVVGTLSADFRHKGSFTPQIVSFLETVASEIGNLLENARLVDALKSSVEAEHKQADESATLAQIGRIISSPGTLSEVYEQIGEQVNKLIGFDRMVVNLVDPDRGTYMVGYIVGTEIQGGERGAELPLAGSLTGLVSVSKHTILLDSEETELQGGELLLGNMPAFRSGIKSSLGVPLEYKETVVGVMILDSTTPGFYTKRESDLALQVARLYSGCCCQLPASRRFGSGVEGARGVGRDRQNRQLISRHRRCVRTICRASSGAYPVRPCRNRERRPQCMECFDYL